jgi:hypothetical protein
MDTLAPADIRGGGITDKRESALSQFSPLHLAREILERPLSSFSAKKLERLVEWAREVVEESNADRNLRGSREENRA